MEYKNMSNLDLKLHLLGGDSVCVDNLSIAPYTLQEIKTIGYDRYFENIKLLSLSKDELISYTIDERKKEILKQQEDNLKTFDFYVRFGGKEFFDTLIEGLSIVFKTNDVKPLNKDVLVLNFEKNGVFKCNEMNEFEIDDTVLDSLSEDDIKIIHRDNFDSIVEIIKLQNYLETPDKEDEYFNPVDEETRKLQVHMNKMREKVERIKEEQQNSLDEDIDISDIISAVSSKSNTINKLNVWDLTLYQLYDEYARIELINNYNYSLRASMFGSKVDVKHWASRVK